MTRGRGRRRANDRGHTSRLSTPSHVEPAITMGGDALADEATVSGGHETTQDQATSSSG